MDIQMDGRTDVQTDVRTDVQTDVRTENLPILQDFVPYRGRCPKMSERDGKCPHSTGLSEPRPKNRENKKSKFIR